MIRLLVLSTGDPEGEGPFSGAVRGLSDALAAKGAIHAKANVNGYTDPFRGLPLGARIVRRLGFGSSLEAYAWSRLAARRRSARALRAAESHPGFTAFLMCGTQFEPPAGAPSYCCFDCTVAQVARAGEWGFRGFPDAKIARLIEEQRRIFELCAAVFPWSAWAAESALNDYGVDPEKVCIAGAGPNLPIESLPHGAYGGQTILFVGRDFERKGGMLLVEAFRIVRRALREAKLVLVGCGESIDEPGVEVVGAIDKKEPGGLERILGYYREASVFCMMSRFEPFGLVVVEAQRCGVPCVVPKRFAFTETVVDGVTGRHVEDPSPENLAGILVEMLSNPRELEAMGKAAREHIGKHYTWELVAERILARIGADLEGSAGGNR